MAATITATLSSATANSYVTLAEANTYFETVPDSSTWTNKTDDQKNRALIAATRWIDSFSIIMEIDVIMDRHLNFLEIITKLMMLN